ncbi:hypothetical protein KFK09_011784 [Dendrobium nobile]|uniref:Uncharacterized protein n=1 Tax=Dendrobium nobile TaxID=94219 RepID=A0A8T3BDI4_DENNO|nr:hypothetical protein KFK09_011784 [Dendrobium nobile]
MKDPSEKEAAVCFPSEFCPLSSGTQLLILQCLGERNQQGPILMALFIQCSDDGVLPIESSGVHIFLFCFDFGVPQLSHT